MIHYYIYHIIYIYIYHLSLSLHLDVSKAPQTQHIRTEHMFFLSQYLGSSFAPEVTEWCFPFSQLCKLKTQDLL